MRQKLLASMILFAVLGFFHLWERGISTNLVTTFNGILRGLLPLLMFFWILIGVLGKK